MAYVKRVIEEILAQWTYEDKLYDELIEDMLSYRK